VPEADDVEALKRRLSPKLMGLPGVSGVGIQKGRLTIYLDSDDPAVRKRVEAAITKAAPKAAPAFVVTGTFRAQ
jgi:hypothetical protein